MLNDVKRKSKKYIDCNKIIWQDEHEVTEMEKQNEHDALKETRAFTPPTWDALPDIELYMDQVTGYLNRQLSAFDGTGVTPSMVNNYVKNGHIDRPEKKKYNKQQIASLYMLCGLKSVLALPEAALLLETLGLRDGCAELYADYTALQCGLADELAGQTEGEDKRELARRALALSVRAAAERTAAQQIITQLGAKKEEQK